MALVYGLVIVLLMWFSVEFQPAQTNLFQGVHEWQTLLKQKRARQNVKARKHNASLRSMVRTYLKRTVAAIAAGDYAVATEAYKKLFQ